MLELSIPEFHLILALLRSSDEVDKRVDLIRLRHKLDSIHYKGDIYMKANA